MDSVKIYTVEMILSSMTLLSRSFCRYIYRIRNSDKQYGAHTKHTVTRVIPEAHERIAWLTC